MTGIERLRAIAGAWDEWGLGGSLTEISDQIERERAEDCYRMGLNYGTVWRVVADMERHCLGHEGMEDSPVARWARELREALKSYTSDGRDVEKPSCADAAETADATSEAPKVTRDPAEDVSVSAYDLLPADERDAIAWVRDHGGLDHVKAEWRSRVPYERYERRRQRLLGHITECETALGRRREIISRLGHRVSDLTTENAELRRRAMPEGCEWPRYESGDLVMFGDCVENRNGTCTVNSVRFYSGGGVSVYGEGRGAQFVVVTEPVMRDPIRKARPKVFAADGEPLEVGQMVWDTDAETDTPLTVVEVSSDLVRCEYTWKDGKTYRPCYPPDQLTHQRPVLDADGNRIEPAMDVWWVCEGDERGVHAERLHVESIGENGLVTCDPFNGGTWVELEPSELYVNRPVLDADGVPIELGDDLYSVEGSLKFHVSHVDRANGKIATDAMFAIDKWADPSMFTHTKPEPPDSLERIADEIDRLREEVALHLGDYLYDEDGNDSIQFSMELVAKRCRALAERERGE